MKRRRFGESLRRSWDADPLTEDIGTDMEVREKAVIS
jgi:hypothetical protein